MPLRILAVALVSMAVLAADEDRPVVSLEVIGRYAAGSFDKESTEIAGYDPDSRLIFATDIEHRAIDAISIADPRAPKLAFSISLVPYGSHANSVAVYNGLVAAAVENVVKTDRGVVALFDITGRPLRVIEAGFEPDMVTFSRDGRWLLVANEGEPNDAYTIDPEGSVTIVDLKNGPLALTAADVRHATFNAFAGVRLDPSVRIYGPRATLMQDIEPEYIAVSADSKTAYVTLQENNALGILDIAAARFTNIVGLGFKDHSRPGQGLDPSDRDNAIAIGQWPVKGMYQSDAVAAFLSGGQTFLALANEGDARDWAGYSELARVSELVLDRTAFPNAVELQAPAALGRLRVTKAGGDLDGDGDYDELWSFGGRSLSIRDATGALVWDSGDALERLIAQVLPKNFNSDHVENSFDTRSDDKGPEPEGVATGRIGGRVYAFLALERISGLVVYDVTNAASPVFVQYINPRDFSGDPATGQAGDLGPEGVHFIAAKDSPTGKPLVVLSQEVSGSTTIYEVTVTFR